MRSETLFAIGNSWSVYCLAYLIYHSEMTSQLKGAIGINVLSIIRKDKCYCSQL